MHLARVSICDLGSLRGHARMPIMAHGWLNMRKRPNAITSDPNSDQTTIGPRQMRCRDDTSRGDREGALAVSQQFYGFSA